MEIFQNICRSCNNERKNMLNIFETKLLANTTCIEEMLSCCTQLPVELEDNYPKQICYLCAKQLEITYKFLILCNKSLKEFEKIIQYFHKASEEQEEFVDTNTGYECVIKHEKEHDDNMFVMNNVDDLIEEAPQTTEDFYESAAMQLADEIPLLPEMPIEPEVATHLEEYAEQTPTHTIQPAAIVKKEILPTSTSQENGKNVVCPQCEMCFYTNKALIFHQKIKHKTKKPKPTHAAAHICTTCCHIFASAHDYEQHLHSCYNTFNCEICPATFQTNNQYLQHMQQHGNG